MALRLFDRPAGGLRKDLTEPIALLEIASDKQTKSAWKRDHMHQRAAVLGLAAFRIAIGDFRPTLVLHDADWEVDDVAGKRIAGIGGDQIEIGAGLSCSPVNEVDQPADAADAVLLGKIAHFEIDGLRDL
jgi:hypothetical protein